MEFPVCFPGVRVWGDVLGCVLKQHHLCFMSHVEFPAFRFRVSGFGVMFWDVLSLNKPFVFKATHGYPGLFPGSRVPGLPGLG